MKQEKKITEYIESILQKLEPLDRESIETYIETKVLDARIKEKTIFTEQLTMIKDAQDSAVEYLEVNKTVQ